ncbi:alpha/beta hydrolase [Winogradskya consettensis]|uniref:Hydrolase n=1 Tax=Winogradskya consettensis TaxID=113560 RepID=A0A919T093_9ACTN|nr:alpha/beta hydrolase [Actinoplanes consettensis]GIM80468.1 hydrolase [Actinoplanes consettensis]
MRTSHFEFEGVRQVYHVAGHGPVCVAHSGGPGIDYAYLRSPELEQHFTMVYLEPVGTGGSGRLPAYTLDTYARFLAAVVDHLGEPRVYVLGHSHGGFVAQRYALDHPSRVAGLALYDTSPVTGAEFWAAAMEGLAAYPARYPSEPEAAEVPAALQRATGAIDDDEFSAGLQAALPVYFADFWNRRKEFEPFRLAVRAWARPTDPDDPFDVRDRLGEITVPTVVIVGAHDFICGPQWASMLHEGIAGSRLVTLEDSGHFGHLEQPAEFVRAMTSLGAPS